MMIRVTVTLPIDPGHNAADIVVTWSPEYGFTVAGRTDLVKTEEIEPRNLVLAPVLDLPMMDDHLKSSLALGAKAASFSLETGATTLTGPTDCANCEHPYHEDECMVPVKDAKGVPCGCVNWIPS